MNPHAAPKTNFTEILRCALRNRQLILQMTKREILQRYRGSVLGIFWSLFSPLLMLGIYTFFFSFVFKARWGTEQNDSYENYAIILFVGLIIHGIFAECINRAPTLILGNANFVKKVIFPLEVLPWVALGSALFQACISFGVLLLGQLIFSGTLHWTIFLTPLIIIPFVFMLMGFLWLLSAAGVYLRDISQATGIITSVLLFVSPIFYSLSMLPAKIQTLALFNPLTIIIVELRNVLVFDKIPDWSLLGVYSFLSFMVAWFGFVAFQKTRQGFADVI